MKTILTQNYKQGVKMLKIKELILLIENFELISEALLEINEAESLKYIDDSKPIRIKLARLATFQLTDYIKELSE